MTVGLPFGGAVAYLRLVPCEIQTPNTLNTRTMATILTLGGPDEPLCRDAVEHLRQDQRGGPRGVEAAPRQVPAAVRRCNPHRHPPLQPAPPSAATTRAAIRRCNPRRRAPRTGQATRRAVAHAACRGPDGYAQRRSDAPAGQSRGRCPQRDRRRVRRVRVGPSTPIAKITHSTHPRRVESSRATGAGSVASAPYPGRAVSGSGTGCSSPQQPSHPAALAAHLGLGSSSEAASESLRDWRHVTGVTDRRWKGGGGEHYSPFTLTARTHAHK